MTFRGGGLIPCHPIFWGKSRKGFLAFGVEIPYWCLCRYGYQGWKGRQEYRWGLGEKKGKEEFLQDGLCWVWGWQRTGSLRYGGLRSRMPGQNFWRSLLGGCSVILFIEKKRCSVILFVGIDSEVIREYKRLEKEKVLKIVKKKVWKWNLKKENSSWKSL